MAELEIKVKSPFGYNVHYKIWKLILDCKGEKEFIEECRLALIDSLRVAGINKTNAPKSLQSKDDIDS